MKNTIDILPEAANLSDSEISLENVPQWGEQAFEWRDKSTYGQILTERYLIPLENAFGAHGDVPLVHQKRVAMDLQSYFATDWLERAPTVIVDPAMADRFHVLLGRIMRFISLEAIASLEPCAVPVEIKHALLSYKGLEAYSPVVVDAYDHDQGLIRLNYYIHGTRAREQFFIDGYEIQPVFGKYRACNFFRRTLFRQRIAWLPVGRSGILSVRLNGHRVQVSLDSAGLVAVNPSDDQPRDLPLDDVFYAYPRGRGRREQLPWTVARFKAGFLGLLAAMPFARRRFNKAWIFIDRDVDADDNAEHLYRWVCKNHPEINAWFLLNRKSADWDRLAAEGFRLVPAGWKRKLLILNSQHIISSHSEFEFGGFDPKYYGRQMGWRFSFVPHGISKDDVSHWLGRRSFDLFFTTSPAEYRSIVDDDTPYRYTSREVKLTGFPRHDELARLRSASNGKSPNVILIMPTWRANLVDQRFLSLSETQQAELLREIKYFRYWREFLQSPCLRALAQRFDKKLVFMAHPNSIDYLDLFGIPEYMQISTKSDTKMLPLINDSLALVTDYTSVAFEMANLRRMVFYYQFDRDEFYRGEHNWREGYFDYVRDGFGPVADTSDGLIANIGEFLQSNNSIDEAYLRRMIEAMPDREGGVCYDVFNIISSSRVKATIQPSRSPRLSASASSELMR